MLGRATAKLLTPHVSADLSYLNAVVDTVGCEKIIKITTALLERKPHYVVLLPDIINAFNTMARASLQPSIVIGMNIVVLECTTTHCFPSVVIGMNIVVL